MTTENPGKILSGTAVNAMLENRFAKRAATGWTPCSVLGERAAGVSRHGMDAGDACSIQTPPGVVIMEAGGAIPVQGKVITGADGRPLTAVGAAAGSFILGELTNGTLSGAAGDEVAVDIYAVPQQVI